MTGILRCVVSVAIVSLSLAAFAADPPAAEKAPALKPLALPDDLAAILNDTFAV